MHRREVPEGEEDTFEFTEEEAEEGPEVRGLAACNTKQHLRLAATWPPAAYCRWALLLPPQHRHVMCRPFLCIGADALQTTPS